MKIKDISIRGKDNYFIRDTKKEFEESDRCFYITQKEYDKHVLNFYKNNKKCGLVNFEIMEV